MHTPIARRVPCHHGGPSWRRRRAHPQGPGSPLHPVLVQHRHAATDAHGPLLAALAVAPGIPRGASRGMGVMRIGVPDPLSAPVLNRHWHRYVATNAHRLPPAALPVTPGGHSSCRARAGHAARRRSALAHAPVGSEMSHALGGTATACWSISG
jgi:hypothetical protein